MKPGFYIKTFLPAILVLIIYTLAIFLFILPYFRTSLLDKKKEAVKDLTTSAISVISHYQEEVDEGQKSLETAKIRASHILSSLRYGAEQKDYFWIMDTIPRMIMHPYRTDLEGKSLKEFKDPQGKKLFAEAVDVVKKNGNGFVNYYWQWKDDTAKIVPKLSYVQLYPEWGWIIGTGIYLNDIEKEFDVVSSRLRLFSFVIIALVFILSFYISARSIHINREKMRAMDKLIESKKKFEMIFNSATDGIIIISPTGKIIEANNVAIQRSGFTREEYLNTPIQVFFGRHPVLTFENVAEELGHKEFFSFELDYISKSGLEVNIELFVRRIKYEGSHAYLAVARDIKERVEIQHKVYNAVIEGEEGERSRVARELHDGISPILATIKLYAQSLKDASDTNLRSALSEKIEKTINEAIRSISDISNNLSPHVLQNFGLIPALRNFIEKLDELLTLEFHLAFNLSKSYGNTIEITIYRIITELINNSIKYSNANNIHILLNDNGPMYLKYRDDGIGFDYHSALESKKGMGLFNIQNRVKSLLGHVKFTSSKGKGFMLEIEIPVMVNKNL